MLLEYEIKQDTLSDNTVKLDLYSVSKHEYYDDDEKVEIYVEHTSDNTIYSGQTVSVTNSIDKEDEFGALETLYSSEDVSVVQCDNLLKTFSFIADKYQRLGLESVWLETEAGVLYLHFTFSTWHFFRSWETHNISFKVTYPVDQSSNGSEIEFSGCQYVSETEIKWRYNAEKEGIDDFMCAVFRNDTYNPVAYVDDSDERLEKYIEVSSIPERACFTDEMYLRVRVVISKTPECEKWLLYDKECNDGTLVGVSAKRLNYKYENVDDVEMSIQMPLASINIPLSLSSGYDTYQEQNINEKFVKKEFEESKNNSSEMEKLVYHPVYKYVDENGDVAYKDIHKIKFNLHFREREEDGWVVKTDGLWNGMGETYGTVYQNNVLKFFSYVANGIDFFVDGGQQSDLLTYLGFTDSDIKYQKSKLKKSFLRLSFYDSPNRANQNLLCYSTLFLDSGNLFAKMMRGADRKKHYVISDSASSVLYDNLRVDTEPVFNDDGHGVSIDEVEEFRLSSQLVVTDRISENSSEGFYLYLWADNDNGALPSDIYMRVDFNHAGYGRVVPMTLPYLSNTNANKIYTFAEIEGKWTEGDGWGVRVNEKYSYIHFKYVYDSQSGRHVYYLDPDTYGLGLFENSMPDYLELNLYEPKINFE